VAADLDDECITMAGKWEWGNFFGVEEHEAALSEDKMIGRESWGASPVHSEHGNGSALQDQDQFRQFRLTRSSEDEKHGDGSFMIQSRTEWPLEYT
jgi:hypothetical protein